MLELLKYIASKDDEILRSLNSVELTPEEWASEFISRHDAMVLETRAAISKSIFGQEACNE